MPTRPKENTNMDVNTAKYGIEGCTSCQVKMSHSVTTRLQYPGLLLICDLVYILLNLRGRKLADLRTSYQNHP